MTAVYRRIRRLAALAAALLLTVVIADSAYGQITYCGGTWAAACMSGTVTRVSETEIQLVFMNVPNAFNLTDPDAGYWDQSIVTEIHIYFAGPGGAPLHEVGATNPDGSPRPFYPTMAFSGDGTTPWTVTEDGRHPSKPEKDEPWFNSRSRDWSVGITPSANGVCGGLIAAGADLDALPNSCPTEGFHTQFSVTFDFTGANYTTSQMLVDYQGQIQRGCSISLTAEGECLGEDISDWADIPEPITTVLLGSGLLGVGGVGWLRRRRKGIEEV
jgi:hypothetical protein